MRRSLNRCPVLVKERYTLLANLFKRVKELEGAIDVHRVETCLLNGHSENQEKHSQELWRHLK